MVFYPKKTSWETFYTTQVVPEMRARFFCFMGKKYARNVFINLSLAIPLQILDTLFLVDSFILVLNTCSTRLFFKVEDSGGGGRFSDETPRANFPGFCDSSQSEKTFATAAAIAF